jgi:hypothetical protein
MTVGYIPYMDNRRSLDPGYEQLVCLHFTHSTLLVDLATWRLGDSYIGGHNLLGPTKNSLG